MCKHIQSPHLDKEFANDEHVDESVTKSVALELRYADVVHLHSISRLMSITCINSANLLSSLLLLLPAFGVLLRLS